jgi:hypothetical protein
MLVCSLTLPRRHPLEIGKRMRVLVCGSRHFNDYELLKKEVLNALPIGDHIETRVISGHARGADTLGERLAEDMGWGLDVFPADWKTHGKRAGPIRNAEMLREGKPDLVVAFRAKDSRGTKHMIEIAQKAGVEVRIIEI